MSVRSQRPRRTWYKAREEAAEAAQTLALGLVVVPVIVVLVAAASLLGWLR